MKLDMHFHSTNSDWKNTIWEIVSEWKRKKLEFMSLTDHDVYSWEDFRKIASDSNIMTTNSVEISSFNEEFDKSLHLTFYGAEYSAKLEKLLENSRKGHNDVLLLQIEKLKNNWFEIDEKLFFSYFEERWSKIDNLNKFNIAEYLYKNNKNLELIKNISWKELSIWDFYNIFIKKWWDFYNDYWIKWSKYEIDVEDSWDIRKKVDWILSIAHPNFTFKKWISEFRNSIESYIDKWVNAIEINSYTTKIWIEEILKAQKKYDLFLTFWSDCHKLWFNDWKHNGLWELNTNISEDFIKGEFNKYKNKIIL